MGLALTLTQCVDFIGRVSPKFRGGCGGWLQSVTLACQIGFLGSEGQSLHERHRPGFCVQ